MMHPGGSKGTFRFSIDRGGTFTDVYAECPGGKVRVMKLLSEDPLNYRDAPTEAIRRILEEVLTVENRTCIDCRFPNFKVAMLNSHFMLISRFCIPHHTATWYH